MIGLCGATADRELLHPAIPKNHTTADDESGRDPPTGEARENRAPRPIHGGPAGFGARRWWRVRPKARLGHHASPIGSAVRRGSRPVNLGGLELDGPAGGRLVLPNSAE